MKTSGIVIAVLVSAVFWIWLLGPQGERLIGEQMEKYWSDDFDQEEMWLLTAMPWGQGGPEEHLFTFHYPDMTGADRCYAEGRAAAQLMPEEYGTDPKIFRFRCARNCTWNDQYKHLVCRAVWHFDSSGARLVRRYELDPDGFKPGDGFEQYELVPEQERTGT